MDDDVDVDDDDGDNVPGWILKEEDEGCGWIGRRSESKGGWQATLARSHPPHFSPFSLERLFNFPKLFVDHPFSSLLSSLTFVSITSITSASYVALILK